MTWLALPSSNCRTRAIPMLIFIVFRKSFVLCLWLNISRWVEQDMGIVIVCIGIERKVMMFRRSVL